MIPKQTAEVFDILSKGQFISSNSSKANIRKLYNAISQEFDAYYAYFSGINLILERAMNTIISPGWTAGRK